MSTPSLLNIPYLYKAGTLYSQIPESGAGDFTVTRTTTVANRSTRINKDGFIETVLDNVPRLDYPLGGAVNGCPALLVEPVATNLYQQSEDFSNAYWSKPNCVVSGNLTIAPDGNLTADKLIMGNGILPSAANQSGINRSETITSGTYRFSVFAKAAEFTGFRVRENVVQGTFLDVNLTNGAITNGDVPQFINPVADNYGNGWYRISWTSPTITNLTKYTIRVGSTGDGVSGIFIWGYQVETGSVATSYIPTTTAAVTRSADIIRKTGITSLIGQSEGTVYFEVEVTDEARDKWFFTLDSASNSFIQAWISTSRTINIQIQNAGAVVMTTLGSSALSVGYHKVAFSYNTATNGCEMFIDGFQNPVASRTITGAGLPAFNNFTFGSFLSTQNDTLKAHVRAGALYPNRLTNAQLQSLTTP